MLFNFAKSIFREHLTNIFKTEELNRDTTIREYHYDKNSSVTKNFYATVQINFILPLLEKLLQKLFLNTRQQKGLKRLGKNLLAKTFTICEFLKVFHSKFLLVLLRCKKNRLSYTSLFLNLIK